MLLLSLLSGRNESPLDGGTKLFEEVCAEALRGYLHWRNGDDALVRSVVFGFPRRETCDSFADALDRLCVDVGEGGSHRHRPDTNDQKDASLDVVAWRQFPDGRIGKHILFGQCATGRNWRGKLLELPDSCKWCNYFMAESPAVLPLRVFLVPHAVDDHDWCKACHFGDLVLDRCRIAYCCRHITQELARRVADWNRQMLRAQSNA